MTVCTRSLLLAPSLWSQREPCCHLCQASRFFHLQNRKLRFNSSVLFRHNNGALGAWKQKSRCSVKWGHGITNVTSCNYSRHLHFAKIKPSRRVTFDTLMGKTDSYILSNKQRNTSDTCPCTTLRSCVLSGGQVL